MKRNIGVLDFIIRMILVINLLALAAVYQSALLGVLGFLGFMATLTGWDPIYTLLGFDTDKKY